jgi:hypothetical protein
MLAPNNARGNLNVICTGALRRDRWESSVKSSLIQLGAEHFIYDSMAEVTLREMPRASHQFCVTHAEAFTISTWWVLSVFSILGDLSSINSLSCQIGDSKILWDTILVSLILNDTSRMSQKFCAMRAYTDIISMPLVLITLLHMHRFCSAESYDDFGSWVRQQLGAFPETMEKHELLSQVMRLPVWRENSRLAYIWMTCEDIMWDNRKGLEMMRLSVTFRHTRRTVQGSRYRSRFEPNTSKRRSCFS